MKKVLVIDTSILCVWLQVPGFETCGPDTNRWNDERVDAKIKQEEKANTTFVLPMATIIETGNHISQCNGDRFSLSQALCALIKKSAEAQTPWAAFSVQTEGVWSKEKIMELVAQWPQLAAQKISIGDATIKHVAEYYATAGFQVEIFTGDQGLKAYEPIAQEIAVPRRRR